MPRKIETMDAEQKASEIKFHPYPTHAIKLAGAYMKALTKKGNLEKGKIYDILYVTDKGMVGVRGDMDNVYHMSNFGHPYAPMGINLIGEEDHGPAANDNAG